MQNLIDQIQPTAAPGAVSPQIVAVATATVPPKAPVNVNLAIQRAAERYKRRRTGQEDPTGERDKRGRWYPAQSENFDARRYRAPTWSRNSTYLQACRTIAHCARMEGIPELVDKVRQAVRRLNRKAKLLSQEEGKL